MKLTIIVPDNSVYVDEVSYDGLSLIGIPSNVRVLQWKNSVGHLEFNDGTSNENIAELPSWAEAVYNVWSIKDAEVKQKAAQAATQEKQIDVPLTASQKLEIIRIERDNRLSSCDWTQLLDTPSNVDKTAWANYRQALRDLPNLPNIDLDNPVYPIPPM